MHDDAIYTELDFQNCIVMPADKSPHGCGMQAYNEHLTCNV